MKAHIYFFLIGFLILSSAVPVHSEQIESDHAKTVATNFYFERYSQYKPIQWKDITPENTIPVLHDGQLVYYAVNFISGFVLISAYDNVYPFLAYSFNQNYTHPEKQENFNAWMGQYAMQIQHAIAISAEADEKTLAAWEKYSNPDFPATIRGNFRDIEPMLTSTWDQGNLYNQMCPANPAGPGGHCYAGCVATAMGQVMYYFRYPETGTGSYAYYLQGYDTISANFENTSYKWDEMVNSLSGPNLAVAELLFHLGVSVDMVYGPNGSGMYNHKAAYSLGTYFKYSPETQYVYRDSTSMDWDSLLITHLDQKIPMYYAGWSVPNINGHAFVVDGYQGDHFYHFNWGWSGSYDGYFYTEELTPGGSNFNLAQELIINCFPDTVNYSYPPYCAGPKTLTSLNGTFDDGSGPVYNYGPNSDCIWLIDPQNEMDSVSNIILTFQRFDLEPENDVLSIYDGDSESDPLIGEFSGNEIPDEIVSSGNKLCIVFHSGDENTAPGFYASYESVLPDWCSGMTVLNGQVGELSDGSYTFYYANNAICMWQIVPPDAGSVTLNFSKFQTEETVDVVKVFDLATNTLLAEYSGMYEPTALPDPVTSTSGKMFVTFSSNSSVRADGWEASYETDIVGIEYGETLSNLNIFPNPVVNTIHIDLADFGIDDVEITFYDGHGRSILGLVQKGTSNQILQYEVSDLSPGVYFVKFNTVELSLSGKFVISR
nr:C10 family peptidase [Bacteroidota bacterium]